MHEEAGLSKVLWNFLRPQSEELITYLGVAFLLAGIAVYSLASNGTFGVDSQDFIASAKNIIHQTAAYVSTGSGWAKFFLFGFWFIVGAITYILIWFVTNIVIDVYNDIVISAAFLHPRSFHQSDYWASIAARTAVRIAAGIALGFYTVFWAWVFAPISIQMIGNMLLSKSALHTCLSALYFIISLGLTLHIAAILGRLVFLRSRFTE
jgi:hypothetical protein